MGNKNNKKEKICRTLNTKGPTTTKTKTERAKELAKKGWGRGRKGQQEARSSAPLRLSERNFAFRKRGRARGERAPPSTAPSFALALQQSDLSSGTI